MSVVARKFGIDLHRLHRRADLAYARQMHDLHGLLYSAVSAFVGKVADRLYEGRRTIVSRELWLRNRRNYASQLNTLVTAFYYQMAGLVERAQRFGFATTRKEFIQLLSQLYPVVLVKTEANIEPTSQNVKANIADVDSFFVDIELGQFVDGVLGIGWQDIMEQSGKVQLAVGSGKISKEFKKFLQRQMNSPHDPRTLITTLSNDHVKQLQRRFVLGIQQGMDVGQIKSDFVNKVFGNMSDPAVKKTMEYNTLRILRTSYQKASTESMSEFAAENKQIVKELERVADGRPCPLCVMLDGRRYPVGSMMDDHPNGACIFTPVLKSLEEMGFEKIPEKAKVAWKPQKRVYPTMQSRFYQLSETNQRQIVGNNKLFDLWKREKFPFESLIRKKAGQSYVMSAKEAMSRLPELGGVNHPKAGGVLFYEEPGVVGVRKFTTSATRKVVSQSDVEGWVKGLPVEHVAGSHIRIVGVGKGRRGLKMSVRGDYDVEIDVMRLYEPSTKLQAKKTLFHEFGHRTQYRLGLHTDAQWERIVGSMDMVADKNPITVRSWRVSRIGSPVAKHTIDGKVMYLSRYELELFADCYREYLLRPQFLKKHFPDAYEYMKRKVFVKTIKGVRRTNISGELLQLADSKDRASAGFALTRNVPSANRPVKLAKFVYEEAKLKDVVSGRALINKVDVEGMLGKLPSKHYEGLRVRVGTRASVGGTAGGQIDVAKKQIDLFLGLRRVRAEREVLFHEVGHNVQVGLGLVKDKEWLSLCNEVRAVARNSEITARAFRIGNGKFAGWRVAPGRVISHVEKYNMELFADVYREYVSAPIWLKSEAPKLYEYMRRRVFRGLEYL